MSRLYYLPWVVAIVQLLVSEAGAQEIASGTLTFMGSAPPPFLLLKQRNVQQELKLSDEQIKAIDGAFDEQMLAVQLPLGTDPVSRADQASRPSSERAPTKPEILDAAQSKRLRQISLQSQGARAIADPSVVESLKLSARQTEEIRTIQQKIDQKIAEQFQDVGIEGTEVRVKLARLRKNADQQILRVLTQRQQSKWRDMIGKPFAFEDPPKSKSGRFTAPGGNHSSTNVRPASS